MAHILVIDDDPDIRELLRDLLADEGHTVEVSAEAVLDLSLLVRHVPDLIILDYLFSGKAAGWRLLTELKENLVTAQIAVVLCTIVPTIPQELQDELVSRGIGVVAKPFHVDDVVRAVDDALHACCEQAAESHVVTDESAPRSCAPFTPAP